MAVICAGLPIDLPPELEEDVRLMGCCAGSAFMGPERCTCWEPIHDREQTDRATTRAPVPRGEPCADCAYRPDSPERRGEDYVSGDDYMLHRLTERGDPFYCHDGMRRIVGWRHPSGVEIDAREYEVPAAYDPPILGDRPYRTDGLPGYLCAGWASRVSRTGLDVKSDRG